MKAQLVYQLRPGQNRAHALVGGEALGRDATLSIRIDHDGVSRRHARIAREGEAFFLEDLGSTNGTFLNGQAISRERLRHLDVITLGKAVDLVFVVDPLTPSLPAPAATPRPVREASSTRATRLDLNPEEVRQLAEIRESAGAAARNEGLARRVPPELPAPRASRIAAVHLIAPGLALTIDRPGAWLLGRDPGVALRIEDPSVSRRHAQLTLSEDRTRLLVQDAGSTNGTELNGQMLEGVAALSDGDRIGLGRIVLEVKVLRA